MIRNQMMMAPNPRMQAMSVAQQQARTQPQASPYAGYGAKYGLDQAAIDADPQGFAAHMRASQQAQQMMQPQVMPRAPQYQPPTAPVMPSTPYGLTGSEQAMGDWYNKALNNMQGGVGSAQQALGNWYGNAINNMQGGVSAAQRALLEQSDLGRNRINKALDQSLQFGQQALGAVNSAGAAASGAIDSGMGQVTGAFDEGVSALSKYLPEGVNAFNQIAALTGASGAPAQQQAYASYMESPDLQFLREQGERSVLQNARAVGGVGGNVLKELQRYGTGVASQGFNDYFNRLKGVSDVGYGASQGVGSLRGQQAGIVGNLSAQKAQSAMQQAQLSAGVLGGMGNDALSVGNAILGDRQILGGNLSNLLSGQGGAAADYAFNTGANIANLLSGQGGAAADYAFNTGANIASGRQQAGRDISAIQQAQGQGLSNMVGGNASNIAQLLSGVGDTINNQQGNLASILANLATNTASTAGNQTSVAQFMKSPDYLKQLSQILGATGAAYQYGG